jgi:hypothetical protein
MATELDVGTADDPDSFAELGSNLRRATDRASDQGRITYLTEGGERVAAIVPANLLPAVTGVLEKSGRLMVETAMAISAKAEE